MGNFTSSDIDDIQTLRDDVNALQLQVKELDKLEPLPLIHMEDILVDKGILCHRYKCVQSGSTSE